jgi:hypothetical protein
VRSVRGYTNSTYRPASETNFTSCTALLESDPDVVPLSATKSRHVDHVGNFLRRVVSIELRYLNAGAASTRLMARKERFDNGRERGLGQEMILGVMEGKMALGMHDLIPMRTLFFFFQSAATSTEDLRNVGLL